MKKDSKFHPFYIFPLLYVASIYLLPVCFFLSEEYSFASYLMYLPIVFGVFNIIVSVKFCKPENRIIMFNSTILVKYALIPFFIIGGITLTVTFLFSFIPVPFMIFVGPVITAFGIVIGWLILVFEAPYAISYLRLSAKAGVYAKTAMILHTILQFFFTLDVIDIMFLAFKEHRWKKLTIFIIVLLIILVLLFLTLIALGTAGILAQPD